MEHINFLTPSLFLSVESIRSTVKPRFTVPRFTGPQFYPSKKTLFVNQCKMFAAQNFVPRGESESAMPNAARDLSCARPLCSASFSPTIDYVREASVRLASQVTRDATGLRHETETESVSEYR